MLILTRRAGESVLIGNDVQVTVVAVSGSQVRIGIKAPPDVSVDRPEIRARKDREITSGHGAGCRCAYCASAGARPA